MFTELKSAVRAKHAQLAARPNNLVKVQVDRDQIWQIYLTALPEHERQDHNCNCCKSFLRQVGGVAAINPDGTLETLWHLDENAIPELYRAPVAALRAYVATRPIAGLVTLSDPDVGKDRNFSEKHQVVFEHFNIPIDKTWFSPKQATASGELRDSAMLFKRALEEISSEAIQTVLELIGQDSIYRGAEFKHLVTNLNNALKRAATIDKQWFENWCWWTAQCMTPAESRVRNSVIGTLLQDLSEGKELEASVKAYEAKVAPANYKRPTALVTPRMVADAKAKLSELGLLSALERRRLDTRDLGPHNALFVHRGLAATKDVFETLAAETSVRVQSLSKCEEVPVEKFVTDVLPTAKHVRLLVENRHIPNFATLTGSVDPDAPSLFQWDNSFGWSYTGGVADSMREMVVARGGRVDGVLRFTHSWNWDDSKPNQSLMDLHVLLPGCKFDKRIERHGGVEPHRVGWNRRSHTASGGVQDVDYVYQAPPGFIPVENITFPDIKRMPEGDYVFLVNNYSLRGVTKSGFRAEVEFGGEIFQYEYAQPLKQSEWVKVATVTLRKGEFSIEHHLPHGQSNREKWNVQTNQWRTVKAVTWSPNHWTKPQGNKHLFFALEGCVSDEPTRPFYNEFLCQPLQTNRKVMEVLAGKIQVADAEGQELSGLGFSETVRNHVYLEIEGAFKRIIKVIF